MAAETPHRGRRAWLLAVLAVAVAAYGAMRLWPGAAIVRPAAPTAQPGPAGAAEAVVDPAELNVRLEMLEAARPTPGEVERNPFRFRPKPAPAPPVPGPARPGPEGPLPTVAPGPPPGPPPIDLRFMGVIDHPTLGKVAAFSDCKGFTVEGQEGKIMDGRYRVVKIGVESVTIEYVNGTGRRTLPLSGCPPR
ncbi:MAG TPA: hypothetical protein VD833_24975 [Vicinamibacterales bacterium]|nr:hypothetical protein [Vicinamibacterales bacterium]